MSDDSTASFQIELNGDPYAIDDDARLTALIARLKLRRGRVAVEINHAVVPKASWESIILRAGDRVEIVNFVGGG
jgi:sulfur carrier protein